MFGIHLPWCVQKNHLLIFSSFLDIWENVEWPRFFGPPGSFGVFCKEEKQKKNYKTHNVLQAALTLSKDSRVVTNAEV